MSWALGQEKIVGLKDSSSDLVYFRTMRLLAESARPDWSFLVGPEELLAETVLLGGHGGINAGATLHPTLYVEIDQAAKTEDLTCTRELSARVMAAPFHRFQEAEREIIRGRLRELGIHG